MPIITAGTSQTVTLLPGYSMLGSGLGIATLGPGPQAGMQIGLQGTQWRVGPFDRTQDVYINATQAIQFDFPGALTASASAEPPVGDRIAVIGDSLQARGFELNPLRTLNTAAITWGCALLQQDAWVPFGQDAANNYAFAVSGVTSAQALASQVPRASLVKADWWSVQVGTNDFTVQAGDSTGTTIARIAAIVDAGLRAGARVVLWTLPPRNDNSGAGSWQDFAGAITAAGSTIALQRQKHQAVNRWIRSFAASTDGVVLCDPYAQLVDPASATGNWLAGVNEDGVHWNSRGAFIAGTVFASVMRPLVKRLERFSNTLQDAFDAINNPTGNAANSPTMVGTGGAVGGAGVSGTPPTGWTVDVQTGTLTPGTAAVLTQARTDFIAPGLPVNGREVQVTVAGAAPGAFQLRAYQAASINVPAGRSIFVDVAFSVTANAAAALAPSVQVFFNSGAVSFFGMVGDAATLPVGATFDIVIRTPIWVTTAPTGGLIFAQFNGVAGSQMVTDIRGIDVRPMVA